MGYKMQVNSSRKLGKPAIIAIAVAAVAVVAIVVIALTGRPAKEPPAEPQPQQEQTQPAAKKSEDKEYTVPHVVSLTQADAEKAILASGLQVGKVTTKESDTVPLGNVISQSPNGLTRAKANSKVDLVVSSGKAQKKDVQVPNLIGKTQDQANEALKKVGLVPVAADPEETTQAKAGRVFKQSIEAGAKVKEGSKVTFTIALAPSKSTVPNVVGLASEDARTALANSGLGSATTTSYSDKVAADRVISQSIPSGSEVKTGTTISICVSLGPKPAEKVSVPDVIGYSWSDAEAAIRSAGLAVRYTGDPAGKVVDQDIDAGTQVDPNTLVTLTLVSPAQTVEVPNLIGMSVTSAESATDAANLALDADSLHGTVVDQWPKPGTQVEQRTTVHVTVDDSDFREEKEIGDNDDSVDVGDVDFAGSWYADRASIDIRSAGRGFSVSVSWGSSATESTNWLYTCKQQGNQLVCNGGGTKTNINFTDDGGEEDETVYTNGSATFTLNNGQLTWYDAKEGAGNDLVFTR